MFIRVYLHPRVQKTICVKVVPGAITEKTISQTHTNFASAFGKPWQAQVSVKNQPSTTTQSKIG